MAAAILAGMARVAHMNPLTGHAMHDLGTETGCAVGLGRTWTDPWLNCNSKVSRRFGPA